jgi:hypothetical protein
MLRSCKAASLVQVRVRALISRARGGTADALRSGRSVSNDMGVQVSPSAPIVLVAERQTRRLQIPLPCGVQVQVLPGTPIRGRGGTAHAAGLIPASCRFESCRPHQFALPSPSGKGIRLTPGHSAVRVRQGAPLQRQLSPAPDNPPDKLYAYCVPLAESCSAINSVNERPSNSLDHLVGETEQWKWHGETERLSGPEINDERVPIHVLDG